MITHIVRSCGIAFLIWFAFMLVLFGVSLWRKITGRGELYDCK